MCLVSKVINPALAAGLFNAGAPSAVKLGYYLSECLRE